jgi:deoxyadenosine/deoxycytidine kinase
MIFLLNNIPQFIKMDDNKKWFIVEGNIGTGKSTLLELLETKFNSEVIKEPLEEWKETKGNDNKNILDYFYKDQNRWAFTFQVNALITRAKSIEPQQKKNLRFVERSIHTDKNVFAQNSHQNGKINQVEMQLYNKYYDWISNHFNIKPTGYIYLRADPEISFARINKRARREEDKIPIEYIQQIHDKHDDWLLKEKNILVLNANGDFEHDSSIFDTIVKNIDTFIKTFDN